MNLVATIHLAMNSLTWFESGPNEISIFKPEAVRALDGLGTKCSKAPWYDIMQPRVSVATTRNKEMHSQRRKIWERAFRPQGE